MIFLLLMHGDLIVPYFYVCQSLGIWWCCFKLRVYSNEEKFGLHPGPSA
jgi:hypothetical protein